MSNVNKCWHTVSSPAGDWRVYVSSRPGNESMTITGYATVHSSLIIPALRVVGLVEQLSTHEELVLNLENIETSGESIKETLNKKVSLTLHGVFSFAKITVLTNSLIITKDAECPAAPHPAN
ncbi:hypothetical protein [Pseudomonas reactans]